MLLGGVLPLVKRFLRGPITLYQTNPFLEASPAEWHEVWCLRKEDGLVLGERHGWWDERGKRKHYDVPVLGEPFGLEDEAAAIAAFDEGITSLEGEGWLFKLETFFDPDLSIPLARVIR
jgi:hypothetical protein